MERKYYRQYENYDRIIPRIEDFPVLNVIEGEQELPIREQEFEVREQPQHIKQQKVNGFNLNSFSDLKFNLNLDDIILVAIIAVLLMEEEKDEFTIAALAGLLLIGILF